MIAGLLLAAGASRRFGGDKLTAALSGRAVLRWSADALAAAVDATYVVVPEGSTPALRDALAGLDVHWVASPNAADGMASSIGAGIAALPAGVDAVVIALGDQPLVDAEVTARVVRRWREGGASAVAPLYDDGRGHPVLFDRALFGELAVLEGDRGARALLEGLGESLALVRVPGVQPVDVDTPALLAAAAVDAGRAAAAG